MKLRGKRRLSAYTTTGSTSPRMKKYSRAWYVASAEKKRRGPIAPQIVLVLKCVRENGHVNPFAACCVHTPLMLVRAQLSTPT